MGSNSNDISSSSDISVLFTLNLSLKDNSNAIEQKLRNNGITTLGVLAGLTEVDLLTYDIYASDADTILKQTKQLLFPEKKSQTEFADVASWLKANNLERFEPNFANIQMKMVPFIRRSDLTANLGIPMSETEDSSNKLWEAMQKLKKEFPPPLQSIDDSLRCLLSDSFPMLVSLSYTKLTHNSFSSTLSLSQNHPSSLCPLMSLFLSDFYIL
jgi:hypothetical protein